MKQEENAGFPIPPEDRVEKPEALHWYEFLEASGSTSLVSGGFLDQPYQPIMQIIYVRDTIQEWQAAMDKAERAMMALKQK